MTAPSNQTCRPTSRSRTTPSPRTLAPTPPSVPSAPPTPTPATCSSTPSVAGAGSTDNGLFNISGSPRCGRPPRSTSRRRAPTRSGSAPPTHGGLFFEEPFTITVTDVNEAPTDIALSASSIAETPGQRHRRHPQHDRPRRRQHLQLRPRRRAPARPTTACSRSAGSTLRTTNSLSTTRRRAPTRSASGPPTRRPVPRGAVHDHGDQRQAEAPVPHSGRQPVGCRGRPRSPSMPSRPTPTCRPTRCSSSLAAADTRDGDVPPVATINSSTGVFSCASGRQWPSGLRRAASPIKGVPALDRRETVAITVTNVAPTAAITARRPSGPEGTAISLTGTVTDPGARRHVRPRLERDQERRGLRLAAPAPDFAFTPDDNGTYVVTLTVTDDDGGVGTPPARRSPSPTSPRRRPSPAPRPRARRARRSA